MAMRFSIIKNNTDFRLKIGRFPRPKTSFTSKCRQQYQEFFRIIIHKVIKPCSTLLLKMLFKHLGVSACVLHQLSLRPKTASKMCQ